MHPLLEEFCRIPGRDQCQPTFFRSVQRRLREEIQPLLDEHETLRLLVIDLERRLQKEGDLRRLAEGDLAALKAFQAKRKPLAKATDEGVA